MKDRKLREKIFGRFSYIDGNLFGGIMPPYIDKALCEILQEKFYDLGKEISELRNMIASPPKKCKKCGQVIKEES